MNNSLKAYFNPDNQRKFKSHKGRILRELNTYGNMTRFNLSNILDLNDHAIQKRLSDLVNEDLIEVCGTTFHNGNECSLYKIKDQLTLFPQPEKLTLKKWLKRNYPEILNEYLKL